MLNDSKIVCILNYVVRFNSYYIFILKQLLKKLSSQNSSHTKYYIILRVDMHAIVFKFFFFCILIDIILEKWENHYILILITRIGNSFY